MPITKPTAFILGAGASADFGLPLGVNLRNLVLRFCSPEHSGLELLRHAGQDLGTVNAFHQGLRYSGARSVDAFLETNPDFLPVGKLAIAGTLLPFKREDSLVPPGCKANNWYESLAIHMGVGSADWLNDNRLSIVTFNYDRSFEHYFTRVIAQRERLPLGEAYKRLTKAVQIVHVHGTLGEYAPDDDSGLTYGSELSVSTMKKAAERILVVSEATDTLPTFDRAYELLIGARRIHFLGFGFNENNVRRLRYFQSVPPVGLDPRAATFLPSRALVCGTTTGFGSRYWRDVEASVLNGHWNGDRSGDVAAFIRDQCELD